MLKKLTYQHLLLIIALPIVLILINPNWIFSPNIADDYIYLGYQLNLPKYLGWDPSMNMYFIERMAWILPGYVVRQLFSPLMANFIVHLGVYYLATFSVYGTLNRLLNAKVAIFTTLLFGQYPLILRSVGWDYVDGYVMALFAVTIFFLTQAVGSKRSYLYLMGAGAGFALIVNTNSFNAVYAPSLAVYYLLLNNLRENPIRKLITTGIFTALGAGITTGLLAVVYYLITQQPLYENTIRIGNTNISSQWSYYFLTTYGKNTHPHWIFLFAVVSALVIFRPLIWKQATRMPVDNPHIRNYRVVLRAFTGLFAISFLVIGVFQFYGYVFARLTFYNANIVLTAFLLLGAIFAPKLTKDTARFSKYAPLMAFFIPMIPLALFSLSPTTFHITNHYALYIAATVCIILAFFPRMVVIGVTGFVLFIGVMLNDSYPYISWIYPPKTDVYVADRYMVQGLYENTIAISDVISDRYDNFSLENFRLYYSQIDEPHGRLFNAISGLYLWSWDRLLKPNNIVELSVGVKELVVLSSVDRTDAWVSELKSLVDVTEIERHRFTNSRGDIDLIFFQLTPNSVP